MEKWLTLALGQEKHKVHLENLVVSETKEVLETQKDKHRSKGHRRQSEGVPTGQSWDSVNTKINMSSNGL